MTNEESLRLLGITFPAHVWRVGRFIIAGGTATAINFAVLIVLTEYFHIWYVFSAISAVVASFFVSFILQKFWTFKHSSLTRVHYELLSYVGVGISNIILNASGIYLLVEFTGMWYLVAQFICAATLAIMNFFIYRRFIFIHPDNEAIDSNSRI